MKVLDMNQMEIVNGGRRWNFLSNLRDRVTGAPTSGSSSSSSSDSSSSDSSSSNQIGLSVEEANNIASDTNSALSVALGTVGAVVGGAIQAGVQAFSQVVHDRNNKSAEAMEELGI